MRQLLQKFWCLIILFIIGIYAQTPNPGTHIIHIYHPWANNPDYNTFGLKIQRWDDAYPGADMTHEAGYWYSYEYETTEAWQTEEIFEIALFYTQNDNVVYSPGLSIDALFTGHTEEDEVWLIPKDSTSMPEIHFSPPEAKVIQFLNPWPNSVPRSILEGEGESERMRINESYCGWFTQFYVGKDIQNLKYKFVNVLDESDIYTASGLNSGGFIDLSTMLSNNDTVWIQPSPHPYGPPVLSANFPNMLAECPYRDLSALVRDQNASNIAFELSDNSNERITGMVQDTLTLDGDIIRGNGELNSQTIEDWFDATESPYDTCINITVEKTDDGMWLYDSDWDGGFFPIDDFNNPNNQAGYQDADGNDRNFHFTMEMWMSFEYHEGSDQTFIFRGDDDVWVFIDRQLTFDIGGIHQPLADTVNLDEAKDQLGLVDGETYSMAIFFCERKTSGSNFLMKTSIDLQSSSNLKYKTSEPSTDAVKYDIYEIVTSQQLDCGENTFSGEEQPVISKFTLTGPQFSEPYELGKGTDYGGITVSEDSTSVTVDTSSIKGLLPGNYTITFTHSRDQTKYGSIVFTVTSELTDMPSPDPVPGEYSSEVSVDYTCATPEARIYYTFDAMEDFPHDEEVSSTSWSLLSEPITLTSSDTIYAVAIADGKAPSYKAMSPYTIIIPQAATPVSDPPSGVYTEFPEVSLTTETPEADIYYTLENGVPFSVDDWEVYSSVQPVYISNSDTLRAVAVAEGYTNSDIMTAIYTIELPPAATPVADPPGGEYQSMLIDTITLSSETENSRIYYTFDGSIPFSPSAWNLFSESSPLSAEIDRTLYAIAVADGHTRSEMLVAQYTLNLPRAETPEITPPGGVYYQTIDDITIQSEYDDARLYYSYSDTARFNPNSDEWTEYSPGSSISFSSTGTIRAVATKYGYNPSLPARETYTIRFPRGISGSYIDTKGDGTINRAIITLDTVVSPDLPEMAYLNSPFDVEFSDTVNSENFNWLEGDYSTKKIEIDLSRPIPFRNQTFFSPEKLSGLISPQFDTSGILMRDSVAPVLISATFTPAGFDQKTCEVKGKPDLTVQFSETVPESCLQNTSELFNFRNTSTDMEYSMSLNLKSVNGSKVTFTVENIIGLEYPQPSDSLNIIPGLINDYNGNVQDHALNRSVSLKVKPKEPCIITSTLSPFVPGKTPIPDTLLNAAEHTIDFNTGTFIICDPNTNLEQQILDASITIYDVAGNIIAESKSITDIRSNIVVSAEKETNPSSRLFIFWNGRNRSNRYVSSGTYFALIEYNSIELDETTPVNQLIKSGTRKKAGSERLFIGITGKEETGR